MDSKTNLSPLTTHPTDLPVFCSKVVVLLLFIHCLLLLPLFEGAVLLDDAQMSRGISRKPNIYMS